MKGPRKWLRKYVFGSEDATGYLFNSVDRTNYDSKTAVEYINYHDMVLYLNRAVDVRGEKVSEVEFVLKDKKGEIIEDQLHPILQLLNKPNEWHTGKQFWKLVQKSIDVTGEAYVLKSKNKELFAQDKSLKLYFLPPHMVKVVFSNDGKEIVRYDYKSKNEIIPYSATEVIRFYEPNLANPACGASLLMSGIRQLETDLQLTEYQANILKNGGFVDGVFKFKAALSKEQIKQMKDQYREDLAEARHAGSPLFLGGDSDYVRLGLNPAELAYLQSKKLTLNDISIMTGVPAALLALTSGETFANAEAAQTIFLRDRIKPLIKSLVTVLDWRLVPEEFELDFIDPTPSNKEELRKNIETASSINAITTNEKRESLSDLGFELEPRKEPEADEILVPFSVAPLSSENDQPQDDQPPSNDDPNKEDPEDNDKSKGIRNHPLRDPYIRKKWGEIQVKRLDRRRERFVKEMREYFDEQEKRLISQLTEARRYRYKGVLDRIFDEQLELKLARNFSLPLLRQFLQDAGEDAMDLVESTFDFNLSSNIQTWLDNRTRVFADEISATTFASLQDQFTQSFDANENRDQLIQRIQETYKGFNETRATTIARTEVHGAMQKGTIEGYRQAGVRIKIWVWASGVKGGAREDHVAIDGEEVPIDMPFSNGLMFPGDPGGAPEDTINCECSA